MLNDHVVICLWLLILCTSYHVFIDFSVKNFIYKQHFSRLCRLSTGSPYAGKYFHLSEILFNDRICICFLRFYHNPQICHPICLCPHQKYFLRYLDILIKINGVLLLLILVVRVQLPFQPRCLYRHLFLN